MKGRCIFDNPLSVGIASGLVLKDFHKILLTCAVHSYLKHQDDKPLAEEVITYILGGMIGRYVRPEAKSLWKEIKSFFRRDSKVKKVVAKVSK